MKRYLLIFLFFEVVLLIFAWRKLEPGKGYASNQPHLLFEYSRFIDLRICPEPGRVKIKPNWQTELAVKLPQLQKLWTEKGLPLLAQTVNMTGKQFKHTAYDVPVFLCPDLPSWGFPMMISAHQYLPSIDPSLRWDDLEFVNAVWHELLHHYVFYAGNHDFWSPMMTKYKDEKLYTKLHMHLYAIQKEAYWRLGRQAEWARTVERAKTFSPEYYRAIDIVEQEGPESFLVELRQR